MEHQNSYTYLEDFSFHDSEREKECRHDDWIDQVLKCSSRFEMVCSSITVTYIDSCPSAAAQVGHDRSDEDIEAQPCMYISRNFFLVLVY
jgi:hypothetical protein